MSAAPSTKESLLVRLGNAADLEAWNTFIELYTPVVYRYGRRRGLQDADAQDVTQEVFAAVSRAIGAFEYEPHRGRFRSWLGVISRRAIVRHQIKTARPGQGAGDGQAEPILDDLAAPDDPEWIEEFQQQLAAVALERIRGHFEPAVWRAFELTWLEGRAPAAAAAELGQTLPWIYKAKFKVLKRYKEELQFLISDVAFFQTEPP